MRFLLLISILLSLSSLGQGGRIVISNNAFITIQNGNALNPANVVLDNSSSNAITVVGSGNIISDGEFNVVRWNIGGSTDTYIIPFATASHVQIPLTLEITNPGTGGTHIDFSTYPTTIANTPYPSMVTNVLDQNTETTNNSDYMIDRFWIIDAMNYSNRPEVNMSFGYDPAETLGNLCSPGTLRAQRFNSSTNSWTGGGPGIYLYYGSDNGINSVDNVVVSGNELYEAWNLVDDSNPLPVNLDSYSTSCENYLMEITWITASEQNSDRFEIMKSTNGKDWEFAVDIMATGNSTSPIEYTYTDADRAIGLTYYRVDQYDHNGEMEALFTVSSAKCSDIQEIRAQLTSDQIIIYSSFKDQKIIDIGLYSTDGRAIYTKEGVSVPKGSQTSYKSLSQQLSSGMYYIRIIVDDDIYSFPVLKQ